MWHIPNDGCRIPTGSGGSNACSLLLQKRMHTINQDHTTKTAFADLGRRQTPAHAQTSARGIEKGVGKGMRAASGGVMEGCRDGTGSKEHWRKTLHEQSVIHSSNFIGGVRAWCEHSRIVNGNGEIARINGSLASDFTCRVGYLNGIVGIICEAGYV